MKQEHQEQPVQWYLTACYCYEILSTPIMEDHEFDELGRYIEEFWDLIEHRHKYLIDRERCAHTSGVTKWYDEWPLMILDAAHTKAGVPFNQSSIYKAALDNAAVRELVGE